MSRRYAMGEGESGALAAYLREIAKLPQLTSDEERSLACRLRCDRADDDALARLVESNLRFVVAYAKRYRGYGVSYLDLIHQGNLGLIEAARRFDPDRNVKFITYAVWWVREAMMHVLAAGTRAVSFPPKLFATLGAHGRDVSLSDPIPPAAHDRPVRMFADILVQTQVPAIDDELMHQAELDVLASALRGLDRKEREIVSLRFGLGDDHPRTLQEIGDRLHLSRERIRQIESRAKDKLRRAATLRSGLN